MQIRHATPDMFDGIYEVLREFGGALGKDDWRRLFDYRFSDQRHRGWVSLEGRKITGYIGAIFSERDGARFCNLTSWIVKKDYRKGSLQLLAPMFELADHTLLNFSPSSFTLRLFQRLGFDVLDDQLMIIPPLTPHLGPRGYETLTRPRDIEAALSPKDRKIYDDHQPYRLHHFVLRGPRDYCYVVASRTKFRRFPVSFVHYASNRALFRELVNAVQRQLFVAHGTVCTVIDGRLVSGHPIRGAVAYHLDQPRLFRPAGQVARDAIDSLYTEFVVLDPRRWTFNY